MKSEAFRYYKSFEHSPKPSKHPNYTVLNDSNVKIYEHQKMSKKELTDAKICKKKRWIQWFTPFCLKPSKIISFKKIPFFDIFYIFAFFIFLGSAA